MISSKPRLVVPYGLKTLLEGVSRAILKTNPTNITQFAAVYFKELIVFREGNSSLDIKDLIKQFHQTKVEKWAEGATLEKKECVKESGRTPPVSCEPTRMEKSTDTEEDNVAGPLFSNKTTQFPSVHAELQPEETCEGVWGPSSKPTTPKTTTPPTSPPPAPVSAEYAYVPADPAQFAAQMLGNVSPTHSEVLMVDVATSTPSVFQEALSAEFAEEVMVSAPLVCSGEMVAVQVMSQTSAQAVVGPKSKAEPSKASSAPLQGEQEPPAYEAPDTQATSPFHVPSVCNDVPVNEGVVYVEQIPGFIVIPFNDQVACSKENEQSPPVSPKPVEPKTSSGMSKLSVESLRIVQVENSQHQSSVHMEAEATVLLSNTALDGQPEVPAEPLDAEGFVKIASEKSLHLEMEIVTIDPDNPGQEESGENSAPYSSGDPFPPAPGGFTEPEIQPDGEDAPEQV
ncbi:calcium-binding tyrosine phosphorylation-regulated protein isoform X1 [Peromyscus californicus insignis]|uniref:calcium-binding tyrosine phosphorylation-regulated protein isoform X1 n=1 Tax=Peromyscus californicus insignis TaxID=564181 RepID=UPI0022A6C7D0|nr:calcium-binding tyrosine phosphorylation-regulated protein isoform X1 [Peromyscus californicus insignis]XP_052597518.1 calcium-binding tyrosine phosphorylation-regulated protein isoform X1 [Peromyscus californicus insignis]XP_052597519.1 calcium-binding tyrosine phosphorylation-regulated protein isoform X1 [Peromyscus californicus insignis]XP_052597520.1 calcium-binding tyrosine phosphorylation-regulated protein isoform X1 [Peromyscus californicus insignis]XP_052597521.1 calcium-binding tyro